MAHTAVDMLLTEQQMPVLHETFCEFFIVQQKSATVHRALDTTNLVKRQTLAFISQDL